MKTTTQYDASVLQQFADDLYARARWIVFTTGAKYGVIGLVLSGVALAVLQVQSKEQIPDAVNIGLVIVFTLVAITAGVSAGRAKAFQLKLQAQQTLCQRQIEINTRTTIDSAEKKAGAAAHA